MNNPSSQKTIRERKKAIKEKWGHVCARCLEPFPPDQLTMGHLLPESKGGPWDEGNLVPLCRVCNQGDRDRLASYKIYDGIKAEMLGPDDVGKARISDYSQRSGEHIRSQVAYVNLPINQRVKITVNMDGIIFRQRTGYIHSADLGADRYQVILDDPIVLEGDSTREVDYMMVNRAAFRYLGEVHDLRLPQLISHTVFYREVPNEVDTEEDIEG